MNLAEAILERRSVRSYRADPVGDALVLSLLESAVHAPSAMNTQPWLFAIVQDRARLQRYSDLAKAQLLTSMKGGAEHSRYGHILRDEHFNIFYDAGTLIVIGCASRNRFAEADCWLAAGNLMLAARAAGLGSCCIGFALDVLNTDAIKDELHIPREGEVVAAIIVGYAKEQPPAVKRAPPRVTAWMKAHEGSEARSASQDRYAQQHPAGFLASRAAPPVTERAGHPPVHDDPGFGAFGRRQLSEGERELSLSASLPEEIVARIHPRKG